MALFHTKPMHLYLDHHHSFRNLGKLAPGETGSSYYRFLMENALTVLQQ